MSDIVERLRFDAVRCEMHFSKGVAGNIEEAADEIERLRAALRDVVRSLEQATPFTSAAYDVAHASLSGKGES